MKLTPEEKVKLILEAIVISVITIIVIFGLFQSAVLVFEKIPDAYAEALSIKGWIQAVLQPPSLYGSIFSLLLCVLIVSLTVLWRLSRRRRRFEIQDIIEGLVIIAEGNYDYRIEGTQSEDLIKVVDSIHYLVDSTVEAMEEEKRLEKSKEELITNVSHDLRTPLTAIIGYLGLVESKQYKSQEDMEKYVSIAYQKSLQMQSLVNDLFEYTQVSQSKSTYESHTFDLLKLLEQVAAEYELESHQEGMAITIDANRSSMFMKGDPERLVRVFTNIISNAFKYGKGGDQIKIKAKYTKQNIFITIANNGEPISKKSLEDVFERFYRVEKSRHDESGSGLGLAISKSIVEGHGGKISADIVDGWTCFKIILPVRHSESEKLDHHRNETC